MAGRTGLLATEYKEINQHLRCNIQQFVNWFSFFLTLSFVSVGVFAAYVDRLPTIRGLGLHYPIVAVFLVLHILAFVAILIFT